jgi:hypothetical protein
LTRAAGRFARGGALTFWAFAEITKGEITFKYMPESSNQEIKFLIFFIFLTPSIGRGSIERFGFILLQIFI